MKYRNSLGNVFFDSEYSFYYRIELENALSDQSDENNPFNRQNKVIPSGKCTLNFPKTTANSEILKFTWECVFS